MESYKCSDCGKKGIKLWRDAHSFGINLQCASCVGVDPKSLTADGKFFSEIYGRFTDQLPHAKVPAVPVLEDEDCDAFWGYTSIPDDDAEWWRSLPNAV